MNRYPLKKLFDAIPRRYDLVNRLFTWGLDQVWRRRAARLCLENDRPPVLDLCCGTGDLAIILARESGPGTSVTALDFSGPMLEAAVSKAALRAPGRIGFVLGNAAELPFPDNTFGAAGIAFAFRNLTFRNPLRDRALDEIVRVLAPGGRFVIVESSQPANRAVRFFFRLYLYCVVNILGGLLSGDRGAYRYLARSARNFYGAEELVSLLLDAGFAHVRFTRLLFGAAAIHVAEKGDFVINNIS